MALIPVPSDTVAPEDYKTISDIELIKYQWRFLKEWQPKQEVWWLLHGEKVIGGLCSLNGLLINSIFRNKLKLHKKGMVITNFYSILGPMFMGAGFYNMTVGNDIILYKQSCELCSQMKANLIMQSSALLFPLTTMPVLNIGLASSLGLRVPFIYEWKELLRFGWNVLKPAMKHLTVMAMLNSITISYITHQQFESINTVAKILLNMDQYHKENKVTQQPQ